MKTIMLCRADAAAITILTLLFVVDGFIWHEIVVFQSPGTAHFYVLDVGQGDSQVVMFPGGVKVMTDAGPKLQVLESLPKVLSPGDTYIDLAVITHPDSDHFAGFDYMVDHYDIGAFIYNGRANETTKEWPDLMAKIAAKHIPLITLGRGDTIRYGENVISILSPDKEFDESIATNDTGIVELVKTPGWSALLTADTEFNVENFEMVEGDPIHVDILKVAHHGSGYASSDAFLRAVDPRLAVIGVGAKNTYGLPSPKTLARLASSTHALILRTDESGTIDIWSENGGLKVKKEK